MLAGRGDSILSLRLANGTKSQVFLDGVAGGKYFLESCSRNRSLESFLTKKGENITGMHDGISEHIL